MHCLSAINNQFQVIPVLTSVFIHSVFSCCYSLCHIVICQQVAAEVVAYTKTGWREADITSICPSCNFNMHLKFHTEITSHIFLTLDPPRHLDSHIKHTELNVWHDSEVIYLGQECEAEHLRSLQVCLQLLIRGGLVILREVHAALHDRSDWT